MSGHRILRHLLWITFIIGFHSVQAQKEKKPSTYESYKSRSLAKPQADELLDEAEQLKSSNPKEALEKVREGLAVSLTQGDLFLEAKSYLLLGEINEQIHEWKLSLENYTTAYNKLQPLSERAELKKSLEGMARSNLMLKQYNSALENYNTALEIKPLSNTDRNHIFLGISEVYFQQGNNTEALHALDKIKNDKKTKLDPIDGLVQNQRAKIFARLNEPDKAKDAIISSQNTLRGYLTNPPQAPSAAQPEIRKAKEDVAVLLHDQARYDDEIELRNQSIELSLETNDLKEVARDKVGLSKALAAKGETSEAIRELEEAALVADTINNPKEQARAFRELATLYEENGRSKQALETFKRYSAAVERAEQQTETKLMEKADLLKIQRDIEELTKDLAIGQREETIAKATLVRQQLVIYGLLVIVVITVVTSYFTYRNAQASKIANQLLALKSLRSQMNPHFIFNALNSVNQFISLNDERTANKFLSEFSRLMRLVLENSQEDFIPLSKEQEIITLYLKLEHYRFRDKFDYNIETSEDLDPELYQIPPMLLQPYIENAVWHGLRYKEIPGKLEVAFKKYDDGLLVEITDDGIGRKRSMQLKTINQQKHQSTGLKNIEERLLIINKVYKSNYKVSIEDLDGLNGTGTKVTIEIPQPRNHTL